MNYKELCKQDFKISHDLNLLVKHLPEVFDDGMFQNTKVIINIYKDVDFDSRRYWWLLGVL